MPSNSDKNLVLHPVEKKCYDPLSEYFLSQNEMISNRTVFIKFIFLNKHYETWLVYYYGLMNNGWS